MCKIIVGIQKEKNADFKSIVMAQYKDLKLERDGIGVLAIMRDGSMKVIRKEDDYETVYEKINDILDDVYFLGVHTRTATSGSHDLDNVHFFEEKGVYLAHNGFVAGVFDKKEKKKRKKTTTIIVPRDESEAERSAYKIDAEIERLEKIMMECADCDFQTYEACKKHKSVENRLEKLNTIMYEDIPEKVQHYTWDGKLDDNGYYIKNKEGIMVYDPDRKSTSALGFYNNRNTGLADSHKFLKILVGKGEITEKNIITTSDENNFSGFAVLYDSRTGKLWLMVNKEVRSVSDEKNYHLLFSFAPELDIQKYKYTDIFGIETYEKVDSKLVDLPQRYAAYGVHEIQLMNIPKTKVEKRKTVNAS